MKFGLLVGAWDGTGMMEGKEQSMTVEYKLSSGGTLLIESLFPGETAVFKFKRKK